MERVYSIVDRDTGEILVDKIPKQDIKGKLLKKTVDNMLSQAKTLQDIDKSLLSNFLYAINERNKKNQDQYRIWGDLIDIDIVYGDKAQEVSKYIMRLLKRTHRWSNIVKVNQNVDVKTWTELWNVLQCKDKRMQQKVKRCLIEMDLVRKVLVQGKCGELIRFYVNPFLFRTKHFINSGAIEAYRDWVKVGVNINPYTYRYFQVIGILECANDTLIVNERLLDEIEYKEEGR